MALVVLSVIALFTVHPSSWAFNLLLKAVLILFILGAVYGSMTGVES